MLYRAYSNVRFVRDFLFSGAFLIRLYFNTEIIGRVKVAVSTFIISSINFKYKRTPRALEIFLICEVKDQIHCRAPWLTFNLNIMKKTTDLRM